MEGLVGHPENFRLYFESHCRVLSRRRAWFGLCVEKDQAVELRILYLTILLG